MSGTIAKYFYDLLGASVMTRFNFNPSMDK